MGEKTGIAWTDHTWSPWIGCTEVSPGCDNCYARELDRRHRYGGAVHWGSGVPRYRTKDWSKPLTWNRAQQRKMEEWSMGGKQIYPPPPAFVFPSLCDPFDNEVPPVWRADLYDLIDATPQLTWLLLTKRSGNAARMMNRGAPPNVWLGASIVNQEEADRDIPKLLATPAAKRFVSYEPALGPVNFTCVAKDDFNYINALAPMRLPALDWIIVGGESSQGGAKARPFSLTWARDVRDQCRAAGVAFFMKQAGSTVHGHHFHDRAGADPAEWPEDLRVQEFPT